MMKKLEYVENINKSLLKCYSPQVTYINMYYQNLKNWNYIAYVVLCEFSPYCYNMFFMLFYF